MGGVGLTETKMRGVSVRVAGIEEKMKGVSDKTYGDLLHACVH